MIEKINRQMSQLLEKVGSINMENKEVFGIKNVMNFLDLSCGGFCENKEGLIYNEYYKPQLSSFTMAEYALDNDDDLMFFEFGNSELYLNDYIGNLDPLFGILVGKKILEIRYYELNVKFPEYRFHLILSYDNGEFPGARLKFYRLRSGTKSIVDEDLSTYKLNGMLLIDIPL